MSVTRTLTALALAATAAITTTTLAVAPAHAGGAPDLGTVAVDHQARLGAAAVTLRGTYTCTVPGGTTGPGTLGVELVTRSGVATAAQVGVTCDGTTRSWTLTAPARSLRPGRVAAMGHLEVCDTAGNCPWNLFEASVQVIRHR